MPTITGCDIAALHRAATRHDVRFCCDPHLAAPYIIDHDNRTIYLNGDLPADPYYQALARGLRDLIGNVIPLRSDHSNAV